MLKRPRRTSMVPRENIDKDAKKGDTSQVNEERPQVRTSGAQPS
jgi:hypothetical protein